MMLLETESMAPDKERYQISLSLSETAYKEMALVAQYKNIPLATHIRTILEQHHESPSYGALVRRAKEAIALRGESAPE